MKIIFVIAMQLFNKSVLAQNNSAVSFSNNAFTILPTSSPTSLATSLPMSIPMILPMSIPMILPMSLPMQKIYVKTENIKIPAKLIVPALVSESVFIKEIVEDCLRFREIILKQSEQITHEDLSELLTSPLAYTMKNKYEVLFSINKKNYFKINENIKINVMPNLSKNLLESNSENLHFKINFRDQLCDFIDKKYKIIFQMQLSAANNLSLELGDNPNPNPNPNPNLNLILNQKIKWKLLKLEKLAQQIDQLLILPINIQLKAVKIGLLISNFKQKYSGKIESEFLEVEYIWNWLFKDSFGFVKSNLWNNNKNDADLTLNRSSQTLDFNQWFEQGVLPLEVEPSL